MTEPTQDFSPGDLIRHIPTGEDWVVKSCDGNELQPAGWPRTYAKTSDCKMLQAGAYSHWNEFKS